MYITNSLSASIYQSSLFYSPGKLQTDTFFPDLQEQDKALVVVDDSNDPFVPVNVEVRKSFMDYNDILSHTHRTINSALNRNSVTDSFLQKAESLISQMEGLAEQAAETGVSDQFRTELNSEAQELLSQLVSIFENASFNGEPIAQGGTLEIAVGLDGETMTLNNADLSPYTLGIESIDLTTQADADTAQTNLEDALINVQGQLQINESNNATLVQRYAANGSTVLSEEVALTSQLETTYAQTSLANARSAIQSEVEMAAGIQGSNLRETVFVNMVNSMININKLITSTREADIKETEQEKDNKETDDTNRQEVIQEQNSLAQFEKQISKDLKPVSIIFQKNDFNATTRIYEKTSSEKDNVATLKNMYNGIINISKLIQSQSQSTSKSQENSDTE